MDRQEQQRQAINKAQKATAVLNDELVQHALNAIKTGVREELWEQAVRGSDERAKARLEAMAWAVTQFENCFIALIHGGEIMKQEMLMEANAKAKAEQAMERARNYGGL